MISGCQALSAELVVMFVRDFKLHRMHIVLRSLDILISSRLEEKPSNILFVTGELRDDIGVGGGVPQTAERLPFPPNKHKQNALLNSFGASRTVPSENFAPVTRNTAFVCWSCEFFRLMSGCLLALYHLLNFSAVPNITSHPLHERQQKTGGGARTPFADFFL